MNIYAIRDTVANEVVGMQMYVLFCFRTDNQAARYFADAVNDKTSFLSKHPHDYELVRVGTVDIETGLLKEAMRPDTIITGDRVLALQTEHQPELRQVS